MREKREMIIMSLLVRSKKSDESDNEAVPAVSFQYLFLVREGPSSSSAIASCQRSRQWLMLLGIALAENAIVCHAQIPAHAIFAAHQAPTLRSQFSTFSSIINENTSGFCLMSLHQMVEAY